MHKRIKTTYNLKNVEEMNSLTELDKQLIFSREAVEFIKCAHESYEKLINLEERTGFTASFIVLGRVICILYSIQNDLENKCFVSGRLNIRHIHEANHLAAYFKIGELRKNKTVINNIDKWFRNEIIGNATVREFLAKEWAANKELLSELYRSYSKATHHTIRSVMQSYYLAYLKDKKVAIKVKGGFDYEKERDNRNLLELLELHKRQIANSLITLDVCLMALLSKKEVKLIKQYQETLKNLKQLV